MPGPLLRIEMLPALHGDCLIVEYGRAARTHRMLIDGGPIGAWPALQARLDSLPAPRRFELVVLTHVDADHVEGLVRLFAQPQPWPFAVGDVWFNGWRHMAPEGALRGARQGEFFSALLARRLEPGAWNGAFGGASVVVRDDQPLPEVELAGGMKLTLLSPTVPKLDRMREAWRKDLGGAIEPGDLDAFWELLAKQDRYLPDEGLRGGTPAVAALAAQLAKQSRPDNAAANGSSIAFLAEFGGKSCLLLGDAHPDAICESLRRLLESRGLERLEVGAVKVAHHGSRGNTSDELMSLIQSPMFLFSTNGAQFDHPDDEAVQRIVARSVFPRPTLVFNYLSDRTRGWRSTKLKRELGYKTRYNLRPGQPYRLTL